ncbi:MAG: SAM-dependent methyltransferase [Gammaproteobacteria bacterium]
MAGTLYLIPTPLDFGCDTPGQDAAPLSGVLPEATLQRAAAITHWITENAKSTRAFLKRVAITHPIEAPLQAQSIVELPRSIHKQGDHRPGDTRAADIQPLILPALQGHDLALVSEAGMPAIADPGSSVVRAAHAQGIAVRALTGPVSLMLALAASGLNGQSFAFVGYIPHDTAGRMRRLKELEQLALRTGQTQILIETPYRNAALLQALLQNLQPGTRLALACGITLPQEAVRSGTVSQWRQQDWASRMPTDLPGIFLLGA